MVERADELCAEGEYHAGLFMAAAAVGAADGPDRDPDVLARAFRVLSGAHLCLDQLAKAGAASERAIALLRELNGRNGGRVELALALHTRALVYLQGGELDPALGLLEEALGILEALGDESVGDRNMVRITMAEVALATENLEHARQLYQAVLSELTEHEAASEQHAAALNALLGKAFLGLGSTEARAERAHEAKDYLARAVEFFEQAYGHGHPEMVEVLLQVAALYRVLGDEAAAEAVDEELAVAAQMLDEVQHAMRAATKADEA
jgi:tetratricopeptide (TPR) repeat protein